MLSASHSSSPPPGEHGSPSNHAGHNSLHIIPFYFYFHNVTLFKPAALRVASAKKRKIKKEKKRRGRRAGGRRGREGRGRGERKKQGRG